MQRGDLLADYADFRHHDETHSIRQQLDQLHAIVNTAHQRDLDAGPDLTALAEQLDEMDVHELGRLSAIFAPAAKASSSVSTMSCLTTRELMFPGRVCPNSLLTLDLSIADSVATGTWSERTSPTGYYNGAVYRGAVQLLVDPTGRNMTGRWLGFDKESNINSGDWELSLVSASTSKSAIREFHFLV